MFKMVFKILFCGVVKCITFVHRNSIKKQHLLQGIGSHICAG